jgi:PST family polysaccharide transporter
VHFDTALWSALALSLLLAGLVVAICLTVSLPEGYEEISSLVAVASLGVPLSAIAGVQSAMLRRELQFRQLAVRTLWARSIGAATGLALALSGAGAWSIIIQQLATTIIGCVALCLSSRQRLGFRIERAALIDLLRVSGPWLASEALSVSQPRIFMLIVGGLLSVRDVGFLNIAFRLVETLREIIGHLSTNVSLPYFARVQKDVATLGGHFVSATTALSVAAIPAFIGVAASADVIVLTLVGEEWRPAVPLVQILSIGSSLSMFANFCTSIFTAIGRPGLAIPRGLVDLFFSTVVLVGISGYGITAVAATWAVRQVASGLLLILLCSKVLSLGATALGGAAGRSVAAAVIVGGAILAVQRWLTDVLPLPVLFAVLAVVGAVTVPVTAAIAYPPIAAGMRELVKSRQR